MNFKEWIIKEMAGTGAIVQPKDCHNPNFQVWGAACSGTKKIKRAKK